MRATRIYIITVVSIIGSLSGMAAFAVVVRFMGPEPLGVVAFWIAFITILGIPMSLDIESAHLKILAVRKDPERSSKAIGAFALLKLSLVAVSVIVLAIAFLLDLPSYLGEAGSEEGGIFIVILAAIAVSSIASILLTTHAARNQTAKQQLPILMGTLTRNGVLIVVGVLVLGAFHLALAYLAGSLITLIFSSAFFREYRASKPRREDIVEYLRVGGPLMAAPIFTVAIFNLDKIVLSVFWTTKEVGLYFVLQSFAITLLFAGKAVRLVLIPGFSEDIATGKREKAEDQARTTARYVNMVALPSIVFVGLFSGPYLELVLGPDFGVGALYFAFLLSGTWFLLLSDPLASLTVAEGRTTVVLIATFIGFLTSIGSLIVFVPESIGNFTLLGLSGLGACISFALACLAQLLCYRYYSRGLKSYISSRQMINIGTIAIIASTVSILLMVYRPFEDDTVIRMILSPVVFAAIMLVGMSLLGELSKDDFRFLLKTTSMRGVSRYVREELEDK